MSVPARTLNPMTALRMDHVSVVVDDLDGAIAFFTELGLEREGTARVEGEWVDRINAIDGLRLEIVMLHTPDGHGRLELTRFDAPEALNPAPSNATPNLLGYRSVMFEVDDIDDMVARLGAHGGELIGEIVQYEQTYRLCYLRGPAGVIVSLAEAIGGAGA